MRNKVIKFFTEIEVFFVPKTKRSLPDYWIRSVFLSQKQAFSKKEKKGLRLIGSVFLSQKVLRIQVSGGAKVVQWGAKILPAPMVKIVSAFYSAQKRTK